MLIHLKSVTVIFTLVVITIQSSAQLSDEQYMDSVITMLMNGDSFENALSSEDTPTGATAVDELVYENGLWRCGNCDVIDERNLIYTENNNVEIINNGLDDVPHHDVQVGLDLEGMQCVTVGANTRPDIRVVSGHCASARVTLAVNNLQEFTVRVYGNRR